MFDKNTYIQRRAGLKKMVGEGIIVLFGNNEAPCNYPANLLCPHAARLFVHILFRTAP